MIYGQKWNFTWELLNTLSAKIQGVESMQSYFCLFHVLSGWPECVLFTSKQLLMMLQTVISNPNVFSKLDIHISSYIFSVVSEQNYPWQTCSHYAGATIHKPVPCNFASTYESHVLRNVESIKHELLGCFWPTCAQWVVIFYPLTFPIFLERHLVSLFTAKIKPCNSSNRE